MSRRVRITAQEVGGDVQTVEIYHTAITASNLILSGVTREQLYLGVTATVPDDATVFLAQSTIGVGPCYPRSGSFTVAKYRPNQRYFTVEAGTGGQVEQTVPFITAPTNAFSQSVNYNLYTSFNINASTTYPYEFDGWYTASGASAGALISTDNPLSITQYQFTGSLTDSIFANFDSTHTDPTD